MPNPNHSSITHSTSRRVNRAARTIALSGLASAALLTGCADLGAIVAARDSAHSVRTALTDRAATLEHLRNTATTDAQRAAIDGELTAIREQASGLGAVLSQVDDTLAEARNPSHPFTQTAQELSPLLPDPVRIPALLGAALAASLFRANQLKRAAGSIAKGIERVKEHDEQFRERFSAAADMLRSVQTATAQRIVDEVTKPAAMLKLPV